MDREKFNTILRGYWVCQTLFTAISLGIFDFLSDGECNSQKISGSLGLDPRGSEILLNGLAGFGFVKKRGNMYRNSTFTKNHLLTNSKESIIGAVLHNMDMWESWGDLPFVVKKGKPRKGFATLNYRTNKRSLYNFALAMHQGGSAAAKEISLLFDFSSVNMILDVGGCTGRYALSIMERSLADYVHILDLPEMVREAKRIIRGENKEELRNIKFIEGSFFEIEPAMKFDLVIISNIIHSLNEDDCITLLKKSSRWLNEKGNLLIHDFTVDERGIKPPHAAMFAVNMLVNTEGGKVYTERETINIIKASGLKMMKKKRTKGGNLVVLCG